MNGESIPLVPDKLVEFEKKLVVVQDALSYWMIVGTERSGWQLNFQL